jgi:hypothetical protein
MIAIEVRLEVHDFPNATFFKNATHGKEIRVPTPVLENRKYPAHIFSQKGEFGSFCNSGGERFVDHDVLASG